MGGAHRVCAALMQRDPQPPPCSALVQETLPRQDGSGQGVAFLLSLAAHVRLARRSRALHLHDRQWPSRGPGAVRADPDVQLIAVVGLTPCVCTCVRAPVCLCVSVGARVSLCACAHTRVYVSCMPVHTCTRVYLSACRCVRKCASACVYPPAACTHVHTSWEAPQDAGGDR